MRRSGPADVADLCPIMSVAWSKPRGCLTLNSLFSFPEPLAAPAAPAAARGEFRPQPKEPGGNGPHEARGRERAAVWASGADCPATGLRLISPPSLSPAVAFCPRGMQGGDGSHPEHAGGRVPREAARGRGQGERDRLWGPVLSHKGEPEGRQPLHTVPLLTTYWRAAMRNAPWRSPGNLPVVGGTKPPPWSHPPLSAGRLIYLRLSREPRTLAGLLRFTLPRMPSLSATRSLWRSSLWRGASRSLLTSTKR